MAPSFQDNSSKVHSVYLRPYTHVFVCHSALSFDAAVKIAVSGEVAEGRQIFLLLFPADREGIPPTAECYEMTPPPSSYSEWTRPLKVARWFRAALDAMNLRAGNAYVIAYLPHPFEMPGNYFGFTDGAADQLELLPDGLINYSMRSLDPENSWRGLRYGTRVALRQASAFLFGMRYQKLAPGHITQFETLPYFRTWCLSEQGLVTARGKIQRLPESRNRPARNTSLSPALLLVDQELGLLVTPQLEKRMRAVCERILTEKSGMRLLYKSHPRGLNRAKHLRTRGLQIEDISGPTLAEDVIPEENVTMLLGFFSTPLVLMSTDGALERFAVFPGKHARGLKTPRNAAEIREALVGAGATLYEVD